MAFHDTELLGKSSLRSSGYGTDFPDVKSIEDVFDAIDICERYDVPYEGLDDFEDFVERLSLHFIKERGNESRKQHIEKSMQNASNNDSNRRKKLISVMNEMLDILHREGGQNVASSNRNSAFVESLLEREGTCNDLATDCEGKIRMIQKDECFIIVAGETSAGKSSVLNLLLEEEILPVHTNSSTSVITLVRYDRRRHVRIVYKTDEPDDVFDLDSEGIEKLHSIAFMKSASEREHHTVKEVHVHLSLPILKCGIVLVDTPGIGENEFLENELIQFISQNQILGFMYIIKTDNAGGVQEDRLLNLLRIVIHKQRSKSSGGEAHMRFDPKAALFVCNRFDLVDRNELEKVKKNAVDKLSECWPTFEKESQVIFFSAEKAHRDIEADKEYINDNYKRFLESLRDLYVTSMERRIKFSYKWIENVLKRLIHHLKSMVKQLDLTDMELKEKSETVREKLEKLRDQSDNVIDELTDNVNGELKELRDTLLKFFRTPYCKVKLLTNWNPEEIPKIDSGLGDWGWIKMKVQEVFFDRLSELVAEWDESEGKLKSIEVDMSYLVRFKLKLLEDDLIDIEKQMQGESSGDSAVSITRLSRSRRRTGSLGPVSLQNSMLFMYEPRMPTRLAGRVMKPITNIIYHFKSNAKVNEYKKNPQAVASGLAKEFYKDLTENYEGPESLLVMFVENLLERPREYIEALGRKIPDMILSNQLLLNRFRDTLVEERENQSLYELMMTGIEELRNSLTEYGEGYIFVDDFAKGEIQIQHVTPDGGSVSVAFNVSDFIRKSSDELELSKRRDIRGLWTVTYTGLLVRNGVEKPIAMRVYLPSSGVEYTFKEVAKLRCLTWQNTNIAEFLGIHNADTRTPAFVYASVLRSVRRFLTSFCNRRECAPIILEQTASGVDYLHNKGLVHMELSQDTVTVNEEGDVKLSGACLSRNARLPEYTDSCETGSFVYLAPEVLRGDEYEPTADIYAYGLLILELVQVKLPSVFKEQRKRPLCNFIESMDPESMLNLEENIEIFTFKTRALVTNCLSMDKTERPEMEEVVEYSRRIKEEEDALSQLPTRRSRGIIKKPSCRTSCA